MANISATFVSDDLGTVGLNSYTITNQTFISIQNTYISDTIFDFGLTQLTITGGSNIQIYTSYAGSDISGFGTNSLAVYPYIVGSDNPVSTTKYFIG